MRLVINVGTLLLMSCGGWASGIVQDYSFEDPNVAGLTGGLQYRPTGTPWTYLYSAGVTTVGNAAGFDLGSAEGGNQAAFIQKPGAEIFQTISGLTVGLDYTFSFFAATRPDVGLPPYFYGGGEDFSVSWNGTLLGTYLPTTIGFMPYTTASFTADSISGVLMFQGIDSNTDCVETPAGPCDRTAYVDNVQIQDPPPPTPEPASAAAMFSGLIVLVLGLRRKLVTPQV